MQPMNVEHAPSLIACTNCIHWLLTEGHRGECHRRAPAVILVEPGHLIAPRWGTWPDTLAHDGCGEFVARPEPEEILTFEIGREWWPHYSRRWWKPWTWFRGQWMDVLQPVPSFK